MKLAIEHSNTKREIDGAFNICGSRADLSGIMQQIANRLSDESWCYGWITIYPVPASKPNTKAAHWDE